jgi:hypothetical protein
MKTVAVLLVSLSAVSCAQERKSEEHPSIEKKRLESVTWDVKSHKLLWVVQTGSVKNGDFQVTSSEKYEISPDDATMAFANEKRGFTEAEAVAVHKLLDTLSLYCAESVIWWDQGKGIKLDPKSKDKKEAPKRETVEAPRVQRAALGAIAH